jgi:hypothetical protein
MLEYTLILHGLECRAGGFPGVLLRDLLDALDEGARGAVRLRMEGRSRAKGGFPPAWVVQAAAFDLVSVRPDESTILLTAPTLREAVPGRFAQGDLFPMVEPGDSGLLLMSRSLADALAGEADSEAFDESLLDTFETFRRVFDSGVEAVELRNGRPGARPVVVTRAGVRNVSVLRGQTPRPRRVRIAGRLDAIRYSDRAFTLVLQSGEQMRGVLTEGDPHELTRHFGQLSIVSGLAHFRPSGALLRIDAERLEGGTEQDLALWSAKPQPLFAELDTRELQRPQGPRSGINAIVGKWPGDETDDEVFAILEEIS